MNWKQRMEQPATQKQINTIEGITGRKIGSEKLTIKQASIMINKLLEPAKLEKERRAYGD